MSYLKTRIRGSRLLNAAHILALIELTQRLHQAYEQAYDKQTADRLLPQNPIRDVTPILNKIRFLGDNSNNPNLKSMLQVRLMQLLSKGCADAFKRAGLATPEEIINKGITIADRPLLDDPANNDTFGLSETTRQGFAKSQAPALTIRSQFTSKGPIIFFRAEAYAYFETIWNIDYPLIAACAAEPQVLTGGKKETEECKRHRTNLLNPQTRKVLDDG